MAEKEGLIRSPLLPANSPQGALRLSASRPKSALGRACRTGGFVHTALSQKRKKGPFGTLHVFGGEGGIRTLDTLLTYTPLAGERLQPLGHFSRFCLFRLVLMFLLRSPVARYSVLRTSPFGSPPYRRRSFAVLDRSVSHSATSPESFSFPRTLRQPLPRSD